MTDAYDPAGEDLTDSAMKDDFDVASAAAQFCALGLIQQGRNPLAVSDALLCQALAVWASSTGRHEDAAILLTILATVRDAS